MYLDLFFNIYICLFVFGCMGLRCCTIFFHFLVVVCKGYGLVVVCELLLLVTSLLQGTGSRARELQ